MRGSFFDGRNLDFVQISYCKNWKIIVENLFYNVQNAQNCGIILSIGVCPIPNRLKNLKDNE